MSTDLHLRALLARRAQLYVCGFLFSPERDRVLLIRKNRPRWQAGRLNGVGGKIEPGETPLEAMRREFREETGLEIDDWQPVADLVLEGSIIHFFAAFDGAIGDARALTDEKLEIHPADALPKDVLGNLRVLVPLALDTTGIMKPVLLADAS